jgi:hypothetical protein
MNDLLSGLLKEAHDDMLQELWDRALIKAFRNRGFRYVDKLVQSFISGERIDYSRLNALKRTPRHGRHARCSVPRYVAAYLPRLNDKLWDSNMTEDQLVTWLARSGMDTLLNPSDWKKEGRERKAFIRATNKDKHVYVEQQAQRDHRLTMRRSNWSVTKKVRS